GAGLAVQLAAAHGERIAAVAAFDPSGLPPESLRHLAGCLNAVVHLGYSGHDDAGEEQGRASLATELRRAGVDFEVEVYPARAGRSPPQSPGGRYALETAGGIVPTHAPAAGLGRWPAVLGRAAYGVNRSRGAASRHFSGAQGALPT